MCSKLYGRSLYPPMTTPRRLPRHTRTGMLARSLTLECMGPFVRARIFGLSLTRAGVLAVRNDESQDQHVSPADTAAGGAEERKECGCLFECRHRESALAQPLAISGELSLVHHIRSYLATVKENAR